MFRKVFFICPDGASACCKGSFLWTREMFFMSPGEVLGLLGPNGAGKSSVMHMLSGDTDPTAGQVQTRLIFLISQVPAADRKHPL